MILISIVISDEDVANDPICLEATDVVHFNIPTSTSSFNLRLNCFAHCFDGNKTVRISYTQNY